MSTTVIALLSGLFGAAISAIFSYYIRIKILERQKKIDEHRLAYVYLSKISFIVAFEIAMKSYIDKENELKTKLKEIENKNFDIFHILSILLANKFEKMKKEDFDLNKFAPILESVEKHFDQYFDYKIPDDVLSKFPQETVQHYHRYYSFIMSLKQIFSSWVEGIKVGSLKHLDTQTIYTQWVTINKLIETSKLLSSSLIIWGNIKKKDADMLITTYIEDINKFYNISTFDKIKLEEARKYLEKENLL